MTQTFRPSCWHSSAVRHSHEGWEEGFEIDRLYQINKFGAPSWWLYSRVLRRKHINKVTLKVFDKTVWLGKRIERILPWRGLTLVAVAKKK